MVSSSGKTILIEIGKQVARATLDSFLADLLDQYPDEQERLDLLMAKSIKLDRALIRDDLLPRIRGQIDVDWLRANGVRVAVKSSLLQFHAGLLRLQLLDKGDMSRWQIWQAD